MIPELGRIENNNRVVYPGSDTFSTRIPTDFKHQQEWVMKLDLDCL